MGVAIVGELVAGGGEFLKALKGNRIEIAAEFSVLRQNHSPTSHEGVDERLLTHLREEFCLADLSSVPLLLLLYPPLLPPHSLLLLWWRKEAKKCGV